MKQRWWNEPQVLLELFVLSNLAFLAVDIFIAHSVNGFAKWEEWIPVAFSTGAPVLLLVAYGLQRGLRPAERGAARWIGLGIGWGGIIVGIAGMLLHLNSQFFQQETLKHLVYTAPFVAPLAYTGLGFLLLMNRMVQRESPDWAGWVVFFALGGFMGNFGLSLADHAQNGFHNWREWIAVWSAAFGVGFLAVPVLMKVTRSYLWLCAGIMAWQMAVGTLGFGYHAWADLHGAMGSLWENLVYGTPIFAPLLFANLALLALLGLWVMAQADAKQGS